MAREGLYVEIMQILTDYTPEIGEKINAAGEKLAKEALKELKSTSPKRKVYPKGLQPEYSNGWRVKKFGEYGKFRIILHNQTRYMLTSILEFGFTHKPDNAFIEGRGHIVPVQKKLNSDFEKAVENIIKNT